jgi:hypothetical protein
MYPQRSTTLVWDPVSEPSGLSLALVGHARTVRFREPCLTQAPHACPAPLTTFPPGTASNPDAPVPCGFLKFPGLTAPNAIENGPTGVTGYGTAIRQGQRARFDTPVGYDKQMGREKQPGQLRHLAQRLVQPIAMALNP